MTHTTTTTAIRISKPTTGLIHSSTLIKLVLVINFFTLLRAAWLLHPSQSTKTSCDLTDFSSTPISSTSSITMAPTQSKDTNSKMISCADSRTSKNKIMTKPKPKGLSSIGSLSTLSIQQIAAVVSPEKGGEFYDCNQAGMVDVDLGTTGTGPNVAVDLTNEGSEVGSNDGGMINDGSFSTGGTEMMDGLNGDTVTYVTGARAETCWQGAKEGSNVVVGKGEAEAAAAAAAAAAVVAAAGGVAGAAEAEAVAPAAAAKAAVDEAA